MMTTWAGIRGKFEALLALLVGMACARIAQKQDKRSPNRAAVR